MILSAGLFKPSAAVITDGFVEFTATGTQSITDSMIPSGVTRVRVHLIGAGGDQYNLTTGVAGQNGGFSSFSAAGVSVMAGGGGGAFIFLGTGSYSRGGTGGSVAAVSGVLGAGTGGSGGYRGNGDVGIKGTIGIDVGLGMGGGGGGEGGEYTSSCCPPIPYQGSAGNVGIQPAITTRYFAGGAGGGYGSGQTLPIYTKGKGSDGTDSGLSGGGGGGAYAMFYAPVSGATTYTNAIVVGLAPNVNGLSAPQIATNGYCRIEWGPGI